MKQLIKKTVFFFLILLMIKMPLVILFEDERDYRRSNFAARNFNTVFVGSSRTKHAVVPAYFDFLMNKKTSSYNFGIDGALPPSTIDDCEELIRNQPSLQYIFFELSGETTTTVPKEPWRSFSLKKYVNAVKNLPREDFSMYHNLLTLNLLKPKVFTAHSDYNFSLEDVFKIGDIGEIKRSFSLEIVELSRRRNLQIEQENAARFLMSETYRRNISRLIELTESKGIKIYFFIPPRLESDRELETVFPIYQWLDEKYKLRVAHYDESLYWEDTSSDDAHLNFLGARLFTEKMGEAFKKREELTPLEGF